MVNENSSIENVYKLNCSIPLGVAIPFILQHILAMFVSNVTPIILVIGVSQVNGVWSFACKGPIKALSALIGLIVGYIVSIPFGMVDFSEIMARGEVAVPQPLPTGLPRFELSAIISKTVIFLVSATETIGDSTALCQGGLDRDITSVETSVSLACDGFASSTAGLFGCSPVTSFSQNVGLCAMTKVVNRFTVGTAAVILIIAEFLPPLAGFFQTISQPLLGGCTIMMFGQILFSGMQMRHRAEFNDRNFTIAALALCIGSGFTATDSNTIFQFSPQLIKDIFQNNVVAVVFIVAIVLNILLPKNEKE